MSTIKANDIQNASGGIPTVKGQRLIPTAWVNFDGTGTVAIRDSENVSSITDHGTGQYTPNFAVAMDNANYCVTGTVSYTGGSSKNASLNTAGSAYPTTTGAYLLTVEEDSSVQDLPLVHVVFLGGQA